MVSASLAKHIQRLSRFRARNLAEGFNPPCFFLNVRTHCIIYRETYIVSRKTDLEAIPGCLSLNLVSSVACESFGSHEINQITILVS